MRKFVAVPVVLILILPVAAQLKSSATFPNQVAIARDSFFDMGPPFDYYDLTILRSTASGTDVERVSLTPPGYACFIPAKIESETQHFDESIEAILGGINPCSIPEKRLSQELQRRKQGLVFSGVNVIFQVQCGSKTRLVKADILDRDIYGSSPHTPEFTSWTRQVLDRIDEKMQPGAADQPIFALASNEKEKTLFLCNDGL